MSEESSNRTDEPSLIKRLSRLFSNDPRNCDDVADMLRSAENNDIIDASVLSIMEGALKVSNQQAREIMIPRSQMTVIDAAMSFDDLLEIVINSQHSRFPVVGDSADDIKGILLAKELLPLLKTGSEGFDLSALLRPATVIPESKRLNVLLQEFREQRYHMAIVVDEYGGVSGLVTIEDILEEIVGEIEDETDEQEAVPIVKQSDGASWSISALTEIQVFNEYFDVGLADDEFDTIGGLVVHGFGRVPEVGEQLQIGRFLFTVCAGDRRRLAELTLTLSDG